MVEDRVLELEQKVGDLRVANATLAFSVEHLSKSIDDLNAIVKSLSENMSFGKGAWWAFGGVIVLMASVVAFAIHELANYWQGTGK